MLMSQYLGDKLSLSKLQNHEKGDVWLFIPNSYYDKADMVNQIIENYQFFDRVSRTRGVGWNVLASYQTAKLLITDGLVKDDIAIRFIYSNKNEARWNLFDEKPKFQKKVTYV